MTTEPTSDLRSALKETVRILSGGRQGYVGDHYIREVQVKQATVDRLAAVLRATPSEPDGARLVNFRAAICPECKPTVIEVRHEDGCPWASESDGVQGEGPT